MWAFIQVTILLVGAFFLFIIMPAWLIYKMIKPKGSSRIITLIVSVIAWFVLFILMVNVSNYAGEKNKAAQAQAAIDAAAEAEAEKRKSEEKAMAEKRKAEEKAEREAQKALEKLNEERENRLTKASMTTTCKLNLQPNLHNPKSLEVDYGATQQVKIKDKLGLELYYYATNGFGATIRSRVLCEFDENGYLLKITQ